MELRVDFQWPSKDSRLRDDTRWEYRSGNLYTLPWLLRNGLSTIRRYVCVCLQICVPIIARKEKTGKSSCTARVIFVGSVTLHLLSYISECDKAKRGYASSFNCTRLCWFDYGFCIRLSTVYISYRGIIEIDLLRRGHFVRNKTITNRALETSLGTYMNQLHKSHCPVQIDARHISKIYCCNSNRIGQSSSARRDTSCKCSFERMPSVWANSPAQLDQVIFVALSGPRKVRKTLLGNGRITWRWMRPHPGYPGDGTRGE